MSYYDERQHALLTARDWVGGPTPAQGYTSDPYGPNYAAAPSAAPAVAGMPTAHTSQPMVTGTSVLGIKYKDGIMMAADTLASYGSLARFRDVQRIVPVGEHTLLGASGEMSDFAYIQEQLDKLLVADHLAADGHTAGPHFIWQYLSRLMYARRSRVNPLWNSLIVGGFRDGKRFLGFVDLQGTTYEASTIATGFGAYLGQPLLRKAVEGKEDTLTKEEAHKLLVDTLRVLYYRDARSLDKIQIATADASGVSVSEPFKLDSDWSFGADIRGYGAL